MNGWSAAGTPGPWSRTVTSPSATVSSTRPKPLLHLAPFSTRFQTARSSSSESPVTVVGLASRAKASVGKRVRARATTPSTSELLDLVADVA
jgi:hypothetical protein